jgi:hypothetical protein
MRLTPARLKIWAGISIGYLLITAGVIWYAATCEMMFCHMALWFVALPWTLFFSYIINFTSLSLAGWVFTTLFFVLLNIAILYVLLSSDERGDHVVSSNAGE